MRTKEGRSAKREMCRAAAADGCVVCGEKDVGVLDFHHVRGKTFAISNGVRSRTIKARQLEAELKKCVVLCANCHRRYHAAKRKGEKMGLEERQLIRHMLAKLLWQLDESDLARLSELLAQDVINELDLTGRARLDAFIERHLREVAGPAVARYARKWIQDLRENLDV